MVSVSHRIASGVATLALSLSLSGGALMASPAPASAATPDAAQICKEILPELNGFLSFIISEITYSEATVKLTQGACVSAIQAGNPTAAAAALCRTPQVLDLFGAQNQGRCTQEVKAFLQEFFS